MKDNSCINHFPKQFVEKMFCLILPIQVISVRNNGITVTKNREHLVNCWVVPYNPHLLFKYRAHIKVEVCNSVTAVKIFIQVRLQRPRPSHVEFQNGQRDEMKLYVDARYLSSGEPCWRLFHFELQDRNSGIQRLVVHLPNHPSVVYGEGHAQEDLDALIISTLVACFRANIAFEET